jgi:hypothetical protein
MEMSFTHARQFLLQELLRSFEPPIRRAPRTPGERVQLYSAALKDLRQKQHALVEAIGVLESLLAKAQEEVAQRADPEPPR